MNFSLRWKIILIMSSSVFCLSSCGVDDVGRTQLYESVSPAKLGSAIFYEDTGFQDTIMHLYIRDNRIGAKAIDMGVLSDAGGQGTRPKDAVWSRDGTVIAVRTDDLVPGKKGLWVQRGVLYTHVYDFLTHSEGVPITKSAKQRSAAIKALLNSRGGEGQKVLSDWNNFDRLARPVTYSDNPR